MTSRGDVLHLKRGIGFEPRGARGAVVVVQADPLSGSIPTVLAVPLDVALAMHAGNPRLIPVSAAECGTTTEMVAFVTQLRPVRLDDLAAGVAGHLRPATLARLDRVLRLVLGL